MYGIGNFLTRSAHQYPNRTAIADISGAMTYLELNANVNRLANNLLRLGLSKGDRLGFLCNNCNQFVELWLATQKVGIVAVLLNYKLTESELGVDLRRALCKGLLYAPSLTERVLACRTPDSQLKLLITFGQKCLPSGCVD
ncbi:MAG: class I adenylate-forming enzyme family protein, partial [Oscillospiraceae bacterium]